MDTLTLTPAGLRPSRRLRLGPGGLAQIVRPAVPELPRILPPYDDTPLSTLVLDEAALASGTYAAPGFVARSTDMARDASVVGYANANQTFMWLRLTESGAGFVCWIKTDGSIEVGYQSGPAAGGPTGDTDYSVYRGVGYADVPAGFAANPTARRYRFTASGFTLRVEFDAGDGAWQPIHENVQGWRHMASGRAAWSTRGTFRSMEAAFRRPVPLYSDAERVGGGGYENRQYSGSDLGLYRMETTGSMAAGSDQLVLTGNPGLRVGASVVVVRGGEAGYGLIGTTEGVGGYSPGRTVQTVADLPTDLPDYSLVYVVETGVVHIFHQGTWAANVNFYDRLPVPHSLRARVLAVSTDGLTLTLDASAVSATENARVVYDTAEAPIWSMGLLQSSTQAAPVTLHLPEEQTDMGRLVTVQIPYGRIEGAGKWHTVVNGVRGCQSAGLRVVGSPHVNVSHLAVVNHFTADDHNGYEYISPIALENGCDDGVIEHTRDVNCSGGIGTLYGSRLRINWTHGHSKGHFHYIQWHNGFTEGDDCVATDCKLTADEFMPGYEPFRANRATFIRPCGVNITCSNNSCNDTEYRDLHLWFDAGLMGDRSRYTYPFGSPAVSFNINAGKSGYTSGALLKNARIAFGGSCEIDRERYFNGLQVSGGEQRNIRVEGGYVHYPAAARLGTNQERYDKLQAAVGMEGAADANNLIDGFRTNSGHPQGYDPGGAIAAGQSGTIRNSVANSIGTGPGITLENNKTVAEWEATVDRSAAPVAAFRVVKVKGPGAYNFVTYAEDGTMLTYSPWGGGIHHFEWRCLRGAAVVWTDRSLWASGVCLPGDVVEATAYDEDGRVGIAKQIMGLGT